MAVEIEVLERLNLFIGLSDKLLEILSEKIEKMYMSSGKILFSEGDVTDSLYIINEGIVEVFKEFEGDTMLSFATLDQGDIFGEMALIDEFPRSASIRIVEDCEFLMLSKTDFDDIMKKDPKEALELIIKLAKVMSLRIRKTNQNLEDYYFLCKGLITSDKFRDIYKTIIT